MHKKGHVAVLRLTDAAGERLVFCCAPASGDAAVCIGDPGSSCGKKARGIVVDVTGPVQITSAMDAKALASWMSAAAIWLQIQHLEEESPWVD